MPPYNPRAGCTRYGEGRIADFVGYCHLLPLIVTFDRKKCFLKRCGGYWMGFHGKVRSGAKQSED